MSKGGRYTINDIAAMAGVSKTTVSFFLNGKTDKMSADTRRKIEAIIRETNYTPNVAARSLNDKQSHLIGVIIGDITNTFANQIVKGIEDIAHQRGYQMIVGNSNYQQTEEESYVERMLTLGVDGFIIQPSSQFRKISRTIEEHRKPLVFFDSKLYENSASWVKTDNYEATYRAVEQLIQRGYQRFCMIGANPSLLSTRIERSSGFLDALESHDLRCESLEIENKAIDRTAITEFVRPLLREDSPLLLYVPNCWALPSVFMALDEFRSRIPEQLGIIGFDNTEWSSFSEPKVTTIVQPAYEEGQTACRILLDQIEDTHSEPEHQTLSCHVNWSSSTL